MRIQPFVAAVAVAFGTGLTPFAPAQEIEPPPSCDGCTSWGGELVGSHPPGAPFQYIQVEATILYGQCVIGQSGVEHGGHAECIQMRGCEATIARKWGSGWQGTQFVFQVTYANGRTYTLEDPPTPTAHYGGHPISYMLACGDQPVTWSFTAGEVHVQTTGGCEPCEDL